VTQVGEKHRPYDSCVVGNGIALRFITTHPPAGYGNLREGVTCALLFPAKVRVLPEAHLVSGVENRPELRQGAATNRVLAAISPLLQWQLIQPCFHLCGILVLGSFKDCQAFLPALARLYEIALLKCNLRQVI